jgi:hypothetical protein
MADQAIKWLDNWKGLRDAPFFIASSPEIVGEFWLGKVSELVI